MRNFSLNKAKNPVFVETLDQFWRLEVREKVRNDFVMSLCLSDHQVLHNIASPSSRFFDFARIFSFFSLVFRNFKLLEFKEFNKTIIPFALVGYETGYSQLISNAHSWNKLFSSPLRRFFPSRPLMLKTFPKKTTLEKKNFNNNPKLSYKHCK